MADKGNPVLTIGALTFSQVSTDDGCLQSSSYADTADEVTYMCNNRNISLPGMATAAWSGSVAIAKTDLATLTMLKTETVLTDFAYYPFGNTTGNIQHTSDASAVFGYNEGEAINSIVVVDFTIAVHNPVDAVVPV